MIADTLATVRRLRSTESTGQAVLLRADSAFYGHPTVSAAMRGGAEVSITVRLDPKVNAAIAAIGDDAWTPIEYTDAVYDETTQQWISRAEVAEIAFTAFSSRKANEQVRGPVGGAPHPRPQPPQRRRAGHPVRHLAFPRVLHHHRPGHRHRRQDPPRARDHRAYYRAPSSPPRTAAIGRQCSCWHPMAGCRCRGARKRLTNSVRCSCNCTRSGVETNLRRCRTVARPNRVRWVAQR